MAHTHANGPCHARTIADKACKILRVKVAGAETGKEKESFFSDTFAEPLLMMERDREREAYSGCGFDVNECVTNLVRIGESFFLLRVAKWQVTKKVPTNSGQSVNSG